MKFKLLNRDITIEKPQEQITDLTEKQMVNESIELFKKYRDGRQSLETRLVENEKWYKSLHWEMFRSEHFKDDPEPTSNYLFSNLLNKHADMMDNYPGSNVLPREENDVDEATTLTNIIPLILELNDHRTTYSDVAWTKLKNGYSVMGVLWNPRLQNGLGDIDIVEIDPINFFWEPGIVKLKDSDNIFVTKLEDDSTIERLYGIKAKGTKIFDPKKYPTTDQRDTTNMSFIIDRYYKKDGKLHLFKFVDNQILYWSENDANLMEYTTQQAIETGTIEEVPVGSKGIYQHGEYPFFIDRMFPEKDTPAGFGLIDIMKNPQMYIDKLDQIISKNALSAGRSRWFASKNTRIDIDQFLDISQAIVDVEGEINDGRLREIKVKQLDSSIINHRTQKIEEIKEISNTNDFSRGDGGKGVTAASAIMALQESGNKVSRDIISASYEAHKQVIYMVIELIREFYDEPRKFRITNDMGKEEFVSYNNSNLKPQMANDFPAPNEETMYRKPMFDIKVVPEKKSPFSQVAYNEMAKEMYNMGFFDPTRADQSLIALDMMMFEGKEKIIQKITEHAQLFQMAQQAQVMQQENLRLKQMVQKLTGQDLGAPIDIPQQGGIPQ